jgi:hypothetical protein
VGSGSWPWIAGQPQGCDPFHPDLAGLKVKFVPMKAGDLRIFNTLLAHGIKPNQTEDRVRMAQYISMYPAEGENLEKRGTRIRSWTEREHPSGYAFPGDPREWGKTRYGQAALSSLGRRLLGLESWDRPADSGTRHS